MRKQKGLNLVWGLDYKRIMRNVWYVILMFFCLGCGPDSAFDCLQNAGTIVEEEVEVDEFKHIIVFKRIQLIVQKGDEQKVVIQTGKNLLNEINVRVEDSILKLSDYNSCNFSRDYDITKIFVTTPDIRQIRNSSGLTVESRGILTFDELALVSEDRFNEDGFHKDGDFRLTLDVNSLNVDANGLSKFYLDGNVRSAFFGLYDSDVRVEAANLEVLDVGFIHRSTNKLIVNPIERLRGQIRGLGDVISVNRPPIVEVEELYTGTLIFQ